MFFDKILSALNMDNWQREKDACINQNDNPPIIHPEFIEFHHESYNTDNEGQKQEGLHNISRQTTQDNDAKTKYLSTSEPKSEGLTCTEQIAPTNKPQNNNEPNEENHSEKYISNRILIRDVNLYFTSIARDVVNQKKVDELYLKRTYAGIDSNEYTKIIQELKDARIIDQNENVIMSDDTIEHFLDIYEPSIFKCEHSVFDKDIFICLGEIIIENGFDYAKSCFSSIDELLDYLKIMERLKIVKFSDGKYEIVCSVNEFHHKCKGVPEYYSNLKSVDISIKNIEHINYDSLSGKEFERFCADLLLKNGFKNVIVTKGSGDHGIDILAEKESISYAIQCKCYSSKIGNFAIQEALTGKKLYRKDIAVVLTNQYFTEQAKKEGLALGVKLWDRDKLNELIQKSTSY